MRIHLQQGIHFVSENTVVLEVFRMPVRIGIDEETRGPEPPIFPAHRTVSPKRKDGGIFSLICRREESPNISRRKESGHSRAINLFPACRQRSHRHEGFVLLIPSYRDSSRHAEELATSRQRNPFRWIGKDDPITRPTHPSQLGMIEDFPFRV